MNKAVILTVLPIALTAGVAASAHAAAGAEDTLAQVRQLNEQAMTDFDGYAYRKGARRLEQALELARSAGLDEHRQLAQTHILLGVGAIAGGNDVYRGVHAFVRALRIDKSVQIPKRLVTPQLSQVFSSAVRTIKALGKAPPRLKMPRRRAPKRGAALIKKGVSGLEHTPIDEVKRGYPIPVKAATGEDIRVHRVFLFYRPAGKVKYNKAEMKRRGNVFRGGIPANFTSGRYVHYYVEARDPRGRVVATNGSARGPNVVIVVK